MTSLQNCFQHHWNCGFVFGEGNNVRSPLAWFMVANLYSTNSQVALSENQTLVHPLRTKPIRVTCCNSTCRSRDTISMPFHTRVTSPIRTRCQEWPVHDWPPELAGHPWGCAWFMTGGMCGDPTIGPMGTNFFMSAWKSQAQCATGRNRRLQAGRHAPAGLQDVAHLGPILFTSWIIRMFFLPRITDRLMAPFCCWYMLRACRQSL